MLQHMRSTNETACKGDINKRKLPKNAQPCARSRSTTPMHLVWHGEKESHSCLFIAGVGHIHRCPSAFHLVGLKWVSVPFCSRDLSHVSVTGRRVPARGRVGSIWSISRDRSRVSYSWGRRRRLKPSTNCGRSAV